MQWAEAAMLQNYWERFKNFLMMMLNNFLRALFSIHWEINCNRLFKIKEEGQQWKQQKHLH